jgi:hypothetical protein
MENLQSKIAHNQREIQRVESIRRNLPWPEANKLNKQIIALYKSEDSLLKELLELEDKKRINKFIN